MPHRYRIRPPPTVDNQRRRTCHGLPKGPLLLQAVIGVLIISSNDAAAYASSPTGTGGLDAATLRSLGLSESDISGLGGDDDGITSKRRSSDDFGDDDEDVDVDNDAWWKDPFAQFDDGDDNEDDGSIPLFEDSKNDDDLEDEEEQSDDDGNDGVNEDEMPMEIDDIGTLTNDNTIVDEDGDDNANNEMETSPFSLANEMEDPYSSNPPNDSTKDTDDSASSLPPQQQQGRQTETKQSCDSSKDDEQKQPTTTKTEKERKKAAAAVASIGAGASSVLSKMSIPKHLSTYTALISNSPVGVKVVASMAVLQILYRHHTGNQNTKRRGHHGEGENNIDDVEDDTNPNEYLSDAGEDEIMGELHQLQQGSEHIADETNDEITSDANMVESIAPRRRGMMPLLPQRLSFLSKRPARETSSDDDDDGGDDETPSANPNVGTMEDESDDSDGLLSRRRRRRRPMIAKASTGRRRSSRRGGNAAGGGRRESVEELREAVLLWKERTEAAESEKEALCRDFDDSSKELEALRGQLNTLKSTTSYLRSQLSDNEKCLQEAIFKERQRANQQLLKIKENMVDILNRERHAMRKEVMRVKVLLEEAEENDYGEGTHAAAATADFDDDGADDYYDEDINYGRNSRYR
mmetsp:Transcript_6908/g.8592  ORF Transcript_6908/g.8592 Transcript_6908/m.8592 type:complete len:635 (+) Transcript_6908:315-2219(+)|eukprot:CAMPEP_0172489674 /NCGR_PEP_ID=MMETSP1066-20121228/19839_1 /TAXON_ID=671091 /ORGANISM="Coscinodiscus wailesii, Strain CCMP2513" /LENGTH=634 /DNA_ID=CAMNT_0013257717 /DNA_START=311 /DNA_END=2215 /DNA_ORIENTATION=+